MVVVAAIQVVVTAVAALVMDCAGRKLLILSGVSMCLSTAAFAVYFKLSGETHGNSSGLCLVESPSRGPCVARTGRHGLLHHKNKLLE